jgi:hypothetical protein
MKKIFALFCAVCLMPTFSAQAWIGGPFSNNSFFEPAGTDGVYEATATALNGIGLYRFSVGNEFQGVNSVGVNATVPSQVVFQPGSIVTVPGISSGNVVIGAWGNGFTNIWYFRGIQYFGNTLGTVNAVAGKVVGMASGRDNQGQGNRQITSSFKANLVNSSEFIAATPFIGVGRAATNAGIRFRFTIIGSKVSNNLFFGL